MMDDFERMRLSLRQDLGQEWYFRYASQQHMVQFATAKGDIRRETVRANIEREAVAHAFRCVTAAVEAGIAYLPVKKES